jgi:hypothetical protein
MQMQRAFAKNNAKLVSPSICKKMQNETKESQKREPSGGKRHQAEKGALPSCSSAHNIVFVVEEAKR